MKEGTLANPTRSLISATGVVSRASARPASVMRQRNKYLAGGSPTRLFQRPKNALRDVIPYIAVAFLAYGLLVAYLFPAYHLYHADRSLWLNGIVFGMLMGVLFDALGGIIEVATFEGMSLSVFFLDSSYHVFIEGVLLGGLICAAVYRRAETNLGLPRAAA